MNNPSKTEIMRLNASLQLHAQDQNFWIFLCFGQSNMAGQAPIEEQDLNFSDGYRLLGRHYAQRYLEVIKHNQI